MGRGCEFCHCNDGNVAVHVCEGCFKLHQTDWLSKYPDNSDSDIYEVRFKNTRKGYYQNVNKLPLKLGDIVSVEAAPGHDIGIISATGNMVERQMKRIGFAPQNGTFKKIYRKAKPYDIEKWQEAIALEHETMIKARQIAAEMNLNMKIGDVEYQGDKIKAIFYYIADERVDFRELIKVFADVFRIRVEMRQIGARQEAGRIGGLGACGRELCCASWISSFMSVTTNAARTQDISLNPQKLAGQCSKLKCCLVYEYDAYMDARREFPKITEPLRVSDGEYHWVKNDILGRTMSFSTVPGSMAGLVTVSVNRVKEVMRMNANGMIPEHLEENGNDMLSVAEPDYVNVIGEDSITRFDNTRRKKKKGSRNNSKKRDAANEVTDKAVGTESVSESKQQAVRTAERRQSNVSERQSNNPQEHQPVNGGERTSTGNSQSGGVERQHNNRRNGEQHDRSRRENGSKENRKSNHHTAEMQGSQGSKTQSGPENVNADGRGNNRNRQHRNRRDNRRRDNRSADGQRSVEVVSQIDGGSSADNGKRNNKDN